MDCVTKMLQQPVADADVDVSGRAKLLLSRVNDRACMNVRLGGSLARPVVKLAPFVCLLIALVIGPLAAARSFAAEGAAGSRPNILLIMCDDMGWSDLGCYGSEINTPNIDRLAAEGVRFRQFYNNAKCTTTRASVVTGLYPRREGSLLKTNMVTLGEVLGSAGYQTSLTGKWHLGSKAPTRPIDRGFDDFYGLLDGCCNFFNPSQPDPDYKGGRIRVFADNDQLVTEFPDDFYTTDAFTDHAIATIRRFAANDAPFLLHLCYTAPHYPLHAKPEDIAKYRGKYSAGWDQLRRDRHERQLAMGLVEPKWGLSGPDSRAYPWETANHERDELRMEVYAAMIDCVDQNIGRLMRTLDELAIDDNTLVMFLSDNGGCAEEPEGRDNTDPAGPGEYYTAVGPSWGWAQNTPFRRYKVWMHEGGISTPLVVRWPAVVEPGTMNNQVGHIMDFMPTFVEVAGATYPKEFNGHEILPTEGLSLVPILEGRERAGHDTLYWEFSRNRAIRRGKWKAAWDSLVREWELYDVVADRTEMKNLATRYPERVTELSEAWYAWADSTGVKYDRKAGPNSEETKTAKK